MMMHNDGMSNDVFEMPVETLAISFTELKSKGVGLPKSKAENLTGINYKSGKTLFRKFIKENRKVNLPPDLTNSISHVRFGGFLQDPITLLLQGDSAQLQNVRNAWIQCRLKAPAGYRIDFVGDVTRISARPLVKGNLVSLEEAICGAIQNVVSIGKVATQSAIANELTRTAPDIHFPNRQLIHETLGNLIRRRRVFCTGNGYHLVTTGTYSGNTTNRGGNKCARTSSHSGSEIDLIWNNRANLDEKNDGRHVQVALHPSPNSEETSSDHVSAADGKLTYEMADLTQRNHGKKKKRVQRSKSCDDAKRSSIVDRVSNTFLWRCGRSGSHARKASSPIPEAVKGTGEMLDNHLCHESTDRLTATCSFCMEQRSPVQLGVPDVIPEKHRHKKTNDRLGHDSCSKFYHEPLIYSRSLAQQKDVGITCNLSSDSEIFGHHKLTRHESLIRRKHFSLSLPASNRYKEDLFHGTVSPRQLSKRMNSYHSDTSQPSQFSPRFQPSTWKGGEQRRVRRSMSSVSERTSNYLHSCEFAPNVRVGSVIAGHLTELNRSRNYNSIQSEDETDSCMTREPYSCDVTSDGDLNKTCTSTQLIDQDDSQETIVQDEVEETPSDEETKAAVKVAKRLAKLNVKMTREEWKDYFSYKILPKTIEEVLLRYDSREDINVPRRDDRTYFENTSSSMETVIDVEQRQTRGSSHKTTGLGMKTDFQSKQANYYSIPTDNFRHSVHGIQNARKYSTVNCCGNEQAANSPLRLVASRLNSAVPQDTWKSTPFDESAVLFYTCEKGHTHFPLCDHHSRVETVSDSASLTEDSGFHSPRDRGSYSAWDSSRPPRGTYV